MLELARNIHFSFCLTQFHIPGNCEEEIFRGLTTRTIRSNSMLPMRKGTTALHREDDMDTSFKVSVKVGLCLQKSKGYR
jgi:hypothetical protein